MPGRNLLESFRICFIGNCFCLFDLLFINMNDTFMWWWQGLWSPQKKNSYIVSGLPDRHPKGLLVFVVAENLSKNVICLHNYILTTSVRFKHLDRNWKILKNYIIIKFPNVYSVCQSMYFNLICLCLIFSDVVGVSLNGTLNWFSKKRYHSS